VSEPTREVIALVNAVDLESISFLELSAKRLDEEATQSLVDNDEAYDVQPDFTLQFARDLDQQKFRIRIKTVIQAQPGTVVIDAAADYSMSDLELEDITEELMLEFANRVALMSIVPYLRQGLADMTQRVFGVPLTMPLYRSGELQFTAASSS
jgi:hypothetical protein